MKGKYLPFDYPADVTPLDVDQSFTIGRSTTDGTAVQINLCRDTGFIVSMRGGGGTTMLHNLTASLARMPNTLVWHIDTLNGGLSAPWLVDEDAGAVDWFATTEDEALRMVLAAVRIAKRRRSVYASEMFRADATFLAVRPDLPQIVILIDKDIDPDSVVGQQIADALAVLRRIGKAMRVNVVRAHLRGTCEHVPAEEKKQAGFALVGRVSDEAEAAYALDWGKELRVPTQVGQFLIGEYGSFDHFDAFRLTMEQIRFISVAVAAIRSDTYLDRPSMEAAGVDFINRWFQPDTKKWLADLRSDPAENSTDATEPLDDAIVNQIVELVKELIRNAKNQQEG